MIAPDPRWTRILASDAEDDAFNELQDRLDREREHAPATHTTTGAPAGQGRDAQPTEELTP